MNINPKTFDELNIYENLLLDYNKNINLIGKNTESNFFETHILDSLSIVPIKEYQNAKNIIDLGTGGGLPGIPLAIHSKDKHFTLVDARNKKIKVLDEIIKQMKIENIKTIWSRFEDLKSEYKKYDVAVSRAVKNIKDITQLSLPFIKKGGALILYKTAKEIEEYKTFLKKYETKIHNSDGTDKAVIVIKSL